MANKNIDGDVNVQFTEASSRQSLETGESVKTLFGKLRKWLSDLKPVAFSGSYNDLSNKPTIPTVNNGTLTIQKNGTNVATFTANQSGNATANITLAKSDVELENVDNTSDANKPISTATQAALDKQQVQIDYNSNQGVKNLFKITAESQTINGVTFTVDKTAGTLTANGTATGAIWFTLYNASLPAGKYTLNGCPSGGSLGTYSLVLYYDASSQQAVDTGEGNTFSTNATEVRLVIRLASGATLSNLVFKPMIRDASIKDDTFEPYAEPNHQLTRKLDKALDQTGYNLFKITSFSNNVSNGITYIVNTATGIVTANGTVTSGNVSVLNLYLESNVFGNLNLSGCANGGGSSTYDVLPFDVTTSARPTNWAGTAPADSVFSESDVTGVKFIQGHTNIIQIRIQSGVTVSNLQFKPMLTSAELAGVPFQPYAMSNMELTQKAVRVESNYPGFGNLILPNDVHEIDWYDMNEGGLDAHIAVAFLQTEQDITLISNESIKLTVGGNTLELSANGLKYNGNPIA